MKSLRNLFGKSKRPDSGIPGKKEERQIDSEPLFPMLEWCEIPSGQVKIITLKGEFKTFDVASFYMSKFPVTYAQFQAFIDAQDGYYNPEWWRALDVAEDHRDKPGEQEWKIDNHPRENVSWYDAVAFCRWLGSKLNSRVYLPTESQRWHALQGGDDRQYPWGEAFYSSRCNTKEGGVNQTTPVNKYPQGASPFGVMDLSGNLWELGLAGDSLSAETLNKKAVVFGGGWEFPAEAARVDTTSWMDLDARANIAGFRCVRFK